MKKNRSIITAKDVLILQKLLEDGRASSARISKEIDLGREIVNYRIKRLIKENLIVKFVPKLNEKAMHYQEYIILLKLNLDDEVSKDDFVKQTIGNKYLVWTIKSKEGWDLVVRLYAQSIDEFKEKLAEILELFSDVLANYYTIISSDEIEEKEKEVLCRDIFHTKPTKDFSVIKEQIEANIDTKDKEILKLLEEDARIQYKEIGDKLDISSDTVKYRMDKMKEQGVIENFVPVINFNKLGFYQYAAILRFKFLNKEDSATVCDALKKLPCVIKAIKSLNNDEFFLTLVFEHEKGIEDFKKEINLNFEEKIETFEVFPIE